MKSRDAVTLVVCCLLLTLLPSFSLIASVWATNTRRSEDSPPPLSSSLPPDGSVPFSLAPVTYASIHIPPPPFLYAPCESDAPVLFSSVLFARRQKVGNASRYSRHKRAIRIFRSQPGSNEGSDTFGPKCISQVGWIY